MYIKKNKNTKTCSSNQVGVLIKKLERNMPTHQIDVVCFSIDKTKASIDRAIGFSFLFFPTLAIYAYFVRTS